MACKLPLLLHNKINKWLSSINITNLQISLISKKSIVFLNKLLLKILENKMELPEQNLLLT